jgi:hypothetical protein
MAALGAAELGGQVGDAPFPGGLDHPPHVRHRDAEELQVALQVPFLLRRALRRPERPQPVGDCERRRLRIEVVHATNPTGRHADVTLYGSRQLARRLRRYSPAYLPSWAV